MSDRTWSWVLTFCFLMLSPVTHCRGQQHCDGSDDICQAQIVNCETLITFCSQENKRAETYSVSSVCVATASGLLWNRATAGSSENFFFIHFSGKWNFLSDAGLSACLQALQTLIGFGGRKKNVCVCSRLTSFRNHCSFSALLIWEKI